MTAEVKVLSHNPGESRSLDARKIRRVKCGSLEITVDGRNEFLTNIVIDKTEGVLVHLRDPEGNVLFSSESIRVIQDGVRQNNIPISLFDNLHVIQLQGGAGAIYVRHGLNKDKKMHTVHPERRFLEER